MELNPVPGLDGIFPGLIYLTGEEPENKILVWNEMHDVSTNLVTITSHDLQIPAEPLPPDTIRSVRAVTIVGYGRETTLTEAIHEIGDIHTVAGVTVTGRYRVEGWTYYPLPSNPFWPAEPESLPYVTELEPTKLVMASDLVQNEFQNAAARVRADCEHAHLDEPSSPAALAVAGSTVLEVLKEGWTVNTLTVEQIVHLTTWAASASGYRALLALSATFEPPRWFAQHWASLISAVPTGFVSIPASLLAVTAWRTGRPLLARRAIDLAAMWANESLPPVHTIAASMITADIRKRAALR